MFESFGDATYAAIAGGAMSVMGYLAKGCYDDYRARRRKNFSHVLPLIDEVYQCLNEIVSKTDCDRALLLKSENGGGIPKLESELYSSIIFEVYGRGKEPMRAMWNKQRLDKMYIQNLCKLSSAEHGIIHVNKQDFKGSMVMDAYEADGVTFTIMAEVAERPNCYIYASFAFKKTEKELTAAERNLIRANLNRIRTIFKKNGGI